MHLLIFSRNTMEDNFKQFLSKQYRNEMFVLVLKLNLSNFFAAISCYPESYYSSILVEQLSRSAIS